VNGVSEQIARRLRRIPSGFPHHWRNVALFRPRDRIIEPGGAVVLGRAWLVAHSYQRSASAKLWTIYKFASKLTSAGLIEGKTEEEAIEILDIWNARGHAVWREPREWLGSPLARRFPLHLISNQLKHRLHSQLDPVGVSKTNQVREREPVYISRTDPSKRRLCGPTGNPFSRETATLPVFSTISEVV
jgi:anaerobic selenocysteine-containing dehydrogenase